MSKLQDYGKYPQHTPGFAPIKKPTMKHLSLFSGYGGIDIAGEWAGMETVAVCERDEYCQLILKQKFSSSYIYNDEETEKNPKNGIPIFDDVMTLSKEKLNEANVSEIDIITAGFPCQPFSIMGQRRGQSDARSLFGEAIRIVDEVRPRWFIGENVMGFKSLGLPSLLVSLERIGYNKPKAFSIPSYSANAAHPRYRLFIVAFDGRFNGGRYNDEGDGAVGSDIPSDTISSGWGPTIPEQVRWSKVDERAFNGGLLAQPTVCRTSDGAASRFTQVEKARIRAAGNGVTPQCIFPIMTYIKTIDDMIMADIKANNEKL